MRAEFLVPRRRHHALRHAPPHPRVRYVRDPSRHPTPTRTASDRQRPLMIAAVESHFPSRTVSDWRFTVERAVRATRRDSVRACEAVRAVREAAQLQARESFPIRPSMRCGQKLRVHAIRSPRLSVRRAFDAVRVCGALGNLCRKKSQSPSGFRCGEGAHPPTPPATLTCKSRSEHPARFGISSHRSAPAAHPRCDLPALPASVFPALAHQRSRAPDLIDAEIALQRLSLKSPIEDWTLHRLKREHAADRG